MLADAPQPRGGTWNRDGVIVFAPLKDYPVKGDPGRDGVAVRKIDAYTLEITNKKAGRVTSIIRAVYAHDGKSRTETTTGTTPQGQKIENVTAWSKQ